MKTSFLLIPVLMVPLLLTSCEDKASVAEIRRLNDELEVLRTEKRNILNSSQQAMVEATTLKSDVARMTSEIQQLKDQNASQNVDPLEKEIKTLNEAKAALQKELEALKAEFLEYKKKYVVGQRGRALGQEIGPGSLANGRPLEAKTKILGFVEPNQISLQSGNKLFSLDVAQLPQDLQDRFLMPAGAAPVLTAAQQNFSRNAMGIDDARLQLQQLDQEVARIQKLILEKKTQAATLESKSSTARNNISELSSQISSLQYKIEDTTSKNPIGDTIGGISESKGDMRIRQENFRKQKLALENARAAADAQMSILDAEISQLQSRESELRTRERNRIERQIQELEAELNRARNEQAQPPAPQ